MGNIVMATVVYAALIALLVAVVGTFMSWWD